MLVTYVIELASGSFIFFYVPLDKLHTQIWSCKSAAVNCLDSCQTVFESYRIDTDSSLDVGLKHTAFHSSVIFALGYAQVWIMWNTTHLTGNTTHLISHVWT